MKPSIPDLFTSNNNTTSMTNVDQVKAELLGNFFSSVFVKEQSWTSDLNGEIKPKITKRLSIEITKEDIRKRILKLNTNKSPGPDNMHPQVVKELASIIVDPFYFVFDLSLKTGRVPSAWKLGSICAIYKNKGSRNSVENYRPITLSSIACKILETTSSISIGNYLIHHIHKFSGI